MTQHRISRIVALTFFSFVLVMSLWNISCSPAEQAEATSKQELSDIEQVVATQQIYNVVMRYIRGHDRADRELVRSVYWEDGYDDHGSMWQGSGWERLGILQVLHPHKYEQLGPRIPGGAQ